MESCCFQIRFLCFSINGTFFSINFYEIFTGKKEHGETLAEAVTMTAKKSSSSRQQFLCPRLPLLTPPHPYLVLLSVHQRPELETQLGQIFIGKFKINSFF